MQAKAEIAVESRFFFSSRRRHTRSLRDWSSDVCSSDLNAVEVRILQYPPRAAQELVPVAHCEIVVKNLRDRPRRVIDRSQHKLAIARQLRAPLPALRLLFDHFRPIDADVRDLVEEGYAKRFFEIELRFAHAVLVLDAEALQVFAAGTRIHQRLQRLLSAFENLLLYDNPPVEMRLLKMLQDGGEVNRI